MRGFRVAIIVAVLLALGGCDPLGPLPSPCCTNGLTPPPGGLTEEQAAEAALAVAPTDGSRPNVVWAEFAFDPFVPNEAPGRRPVWIVRLEGIALAAPTCPAGYLLHPPSNADPPCLDVDGGLNVVLDFYSGALRGWTH